MRFFELLVDVIKALAWPALLAWISWWFRDEVRAAIPRLRKAGPTGLEFDAAIAQQKAEKPTEGALEPSRIALLPPPGSAVAIIEGNIDRTLNEMNLRAPTERAPALLRALAQSELSLAHERVYKVIFGSQIVGLRHLNDGRRVPIEEARAFFDTYRSAYPEFYDNYGFERWLGFLATQDLVRIDGGCVEITEFGRDFLLYITSRGLTEAKPY